MTANKNLFSRISLLLAHCAQIVASCVRSLFSLSASEQLMQPESAQSEGFRSRNSRHSTTVKFQNQSSAPVKIYWFNYRGEQTLYHQLPIGGEITQQTFTTHPWTFFKTLGDPQAVVWENKRLLYPRREPTTVVLTDPKYLEFSEATFKHYPDGFKDLVRELLRCRHRLYEDPSGGLVRVRDALSVSKRPRTRTWAAAVRLATGLSSPLAAHEQIQAAIDMAAATAGLGSLPHDLLLEVLARAAPPVFVAEPAVDEEPDQGPPGLPPPNAGPLPQPNLQPE